MKITLFGLAGSGTSTVGKLLASKLNLEFMSTGNIFRQYASDAGMNLYDFENKVAKKDLNFDITLDKEVAKYGQKNDNFVFESRLAWNFIPDSHKIFLDCEVSERYRRIQEREGGSIEDITRYNSIREQELEVRYAEVYPHISFPPSKEYFDLYIDATTLPVDDIIIHILQELSSGNSIS